MGVCRQPDVVLRNEQLEGNLSKPGKESAVTGAQQSTDIPQDNVAQDRNKGDIRMNLIAVRLGATHECKCGVEPKTQQGSKGNREGKAPGEQVPVVVVPNDPVLPQQVVCKAKQHAARHTIAINLPAKPPLLDRVISGNEQSLPRSCDEYLLKEHL